MRVCYIMSSMEENSFFKEKESKVGPMIGSLIIIVVIVVGGLFYLSQKVNERKEELKMQEIEKERLLLDAKAIEDKANASSTVEKDKENPKIVK